MSLRKAVYPGTFDPITNGHVDILRRSLDLFDQVVVAIANNLNKAPLFTMDERTRFIESAIDEPAFQKKVRFDSFDGLLVDYCKSNGVTAIVRGLRAPSDFDFEFQLAVMNRRLAPGVESIFLMTSEENFYLSSSLIKEVARFGGDLDGLVPPEVAKALATKFPQKKP